MMQKSKNSWRHKNRFKNIPASRQNLEATFALLLPQCFQMSIMKRTSENTVEN